MNLKECMKTAPVLISEATTKAALLVELAESLTDAARMPVEKLLNAIDAREKLMSTGIGQGIAVPHVRLKDIHRPMLSLAICPVGLSDYQSLDSQPVKVVVLILCPQGQHETYIRLLAEVVGVLQDAARREQILSAPTAEALRAYWLDDEPEDE